MCFSFNTLVSLICWFLMVSTFGQSKVHTLPCLLKVSANINGRRVSGGACAMCIHSEWGPPTTWGIFKENSKIEWIYLKASLSYDGKEPRPGWVHSQHSGGSFTNFELTDLVQKLHCACIMKIWNVECWMCSYRKNLADLGSVVWCAQHVPFNGWT